MTDPMGINLLAVTPGLTVNDVLTEPNLDDGLLYIVHYANVDQIVMVYVSNPLAPSEAGSLGLGVYVFGVAASSPLAVAVSNELFVAYDVSRPTLRPRWRYSW